MRTPLATLSLTIEESIVRGEPNMRRFATVKIRGALRIKKLAVINVQISRSIKYGRSTANHGKPGIIRKCDDNVRSM